MTMTHVLPAAPAELFDAATKKPRFGTYVGSLPTVPFEGSLPSVITRGKRWMYAIIVSDEIICCTAVVRMGYASNAFAFVVDRQQGRMIAETTALGPSLFSSVARQASEGAEARFGIGPKQFNIDRPIGSQNYFINVRSSDVRIEARLSAKNAPPPLSVVCDLPSGGYSTTEKGALLEAEGSVFVNGRKFDLKGAWGGYDYTAGLLERHTAWKWAFGMGRCSQGKPIAYNLTEGFVGQRECVVWRDGDIIPLGAAKFLFDRKRLLDPWHIRTDKLDVNFDAAAMHEERHNLLIIRSRFQQVGGNFRGKLVLPNETVSFEKIAGVTEDQDTLW
jgi:Protein of unknown function (DUF2804)